MNRSCKSCRHYNPNNYWLFILTDWFRRTFKTGKEEYRHGFATCSHPNAYKPLDAGRIAYAKVEFEWNCKGSRWEPKGGGDDLP